jgi:hypothetical protein
VITAGEDSTAARTAWPCDLPEPEPVTVAVTAPELGRSGLEADDRGGGRQRHAEKRAWSRDRDRDLQAASRQNHSWGGAVLIVILILIVIGPEGPVDDDDDDEGDDGERE